MAQELAFAGAQQPLDGMATAKGETTEIELSRTEQALVRRVSESKATIPHLVLHADVDMHECVALHRRLGADHDGEDGAAPAVTPSYDDMVVKACALALRERPRANSSYRDGRLQLHARVNVGLALWVEPDESDDCGDARGGAPVAPVVATVFDADLKSLQEIARETRVLAARARAGSLTPPERSGATCTVASLSAFPVTSFTAIVNPSQAAILTVGALELRPVARAGTILARHTLTATLACDARVLHDADAARFLARVRELLERPATLMA